MTRGSTPTKVLFVSHAAGRGGAELFLRDVISRFSSLDASALFFQDGPIVADIRSSGIPTLVLGAKGRPVTLKRGSGFVALLRAAPDLVATVLRLVGVVRRYDIVCANSQKAFFLAAIAARLTGRPFVWILHDIVTDPSFSRSMRMAIRIFVRHFTSLVIVNSEASGRALSAIGAAPGKMVVVYNGFDAPAAAPDQRQAVRARIFAEIDARDVPTVGLFGRVARWKGQHVLIDALGRHPDLQAFIVGDATYEDESYERGLRRQVEETGCAGRVHFLGFRSDVVTLMEAVDVVAHTSITPEPFGRVIVEAMARGRPVVAARGGGVDEIVRDGIDGLLVASGDAPALGMAIRRLIDDPDLARTIGRAGHVTARDRFAIATTMTRLEEALRGMLPDDDVQASADLHSARPPSAPLGIATGPTGQLRKQRS